MAVLEQKVTGVQSLGAWRSLLAAHQAIKQGGAESGAQSFDRESAPRQPGQQQGRQDPAGTGPLVLGLGPHHEAPASRVFEPFLLEHGDAEGLDEKYFQKQGDE